MTTKQIEAKQAQAQIPFELAKQIRELLDAARKQYGATEWDDNDLESTVLEMVSE